MNEDEEFYNRTCSRCGHEYDVRDGCQLCLEYAFGKAYYGVDDPSVYDNDPNWGLLAKTRTYREEPERFPTTDQTDQPF